ncbi:MAG: lasso peptide biosynthesis protein, partial [Phenylobacterium sp.]|nr:lasso peptide biosynthesis protein [Phenylobacterium sp.]
MLLDVAAGNYSCIPNGGELLQDLGEHFSLEIPESTFGDALAEAGWITRGFAAQPRAALRRPARSLSIEAGKASAQDVWRMGQALIDVAAHYHGRSFAHLIATARQRRPVQGAADVQALAHQVGVFRALLPWAPFQGVCLYRSFLLLNLLRHAGLDAVWAFGVRT